MRAEYDLGSPGFFTDPYPTYARMRREDPVHRQESTGIWYASRHREIGELCRDRRFSSARVDGLFVGVGDDLAMERDVVHRFFADWLVFMDPPAHTRLRAVINHAFVPKRIEALQGFVQRVVDDAVDRLAELGEFDLVREFCFPVPDEVIMRLIGVPSGDAQDFRRWSGDVFRVPALVGDPRENLKIAYQGVLSLEAYFRKLIGERRRRPTTGDLLGLLLTADENGDILTEQQLVSTCALLLVAGHETTTNLIGNAVIALLRNPAEFARLREDPGLIEAATEEFQRYDSPTGGIARVATEQVVLGEQTIAPGEMVMGLTWSANRDETVYSDPDRFWIGRPDVRNLGFGHGPHICLGAALARLEARIAVGTLVRRLPGLAFTTDTLEWRPTFATRGVRSLPLTA